MLSRCPVLPWMHSDTSNIVWWIRIVADNLRKTTCTKRLLYFTDVPWHLALLATTWSSVQTANRIAYQMCDTFVYLRHSCRCTYPPHANYLIKKRSLQQDSLQFSMFLLPGPIIPINPHTTCSVQDVTCFPSLNMPTVSAYHSTKISS